MQRLVCLFLLALSAACSHKPQETQDPYLWMEDIEGAKPMEWVKTENAESQQALAQGERFKTMEKDALKILAATDKIPSVDFVGKKLMNFWQDGSHVRGLLRMTTLAEYKKAKPKWDIILDVDDLAKKETENWIFQDMTCLPPQNIHCLVYLSRGGKDAAVVREFDLEKKSFVKDGFELPEAKSRLSWFNNDFVIVGTDFGPGTLTNSGYPRLLKLWKRGTPLSSAPVIFESSKEDMVVQSMHIMHGKKTVDVISRYVDFFNTEEYLFQMQDLSRRMVPKPAGAMFQGFFDGWLLYKLQKDYELSGKKFAAGSLVAISEKAVGRMLAPDDIQLIFTPKANQSYIGAAELKTQLVVSVIEDVRPRTMAFQLKKDKWTAGKDMPLPRDGSVSLSSASDETDQMFYYYENYNRAPSQYLYDVKKPKPQLYKTLPERFDAKNVVVEWRFAKSKDGTRVPYSLTYKKGIKFNGTAPVLQTGYGGFDRSMVPEYTPLFGKLWVERGGVYVMANIRGGGEYGPAWHLAALKTQRQKAFDDFIAISEDLIATKVTSPEHLAIRGRSNGGLLMGAMITQRPELYGAVICGVPLADMMRYNQMLAGASWMGEYGDPNIPAEREALLRYSPYQNLSAAKKYPPIYFFTSTKDDRVHPGHARKMAARMKEQKHQVLYYENTEGGHKGSANFDQLAKMTAMEVEFLFQTVAKPPEAPKTALNF